MNEENELELEAEDNDIDGLFDWAVTTSVLVELT